MSSMENPPRLRRGRNHSLVQGQVATVQGQAATGAPDPVKKVKSLHFLQTPATDVGKADTKKHRTAKLVDATCRGCGKKGLYEKVCLKGKHSTHSLEAPQAGFAGAGASGEPLYFNDEGQPVYTYMVSVPHVNKHLIKIPIALEHTTLKQGGITWILLTPLCCSRQTQGQMST